MEAKSGWQCVARIGLDLWAIGRRGGGLSPCLLLAATGDQAIHNATAAASLASGEANPNANPPLGRHGQHHPLFREPDAETPAEEQFSGEDDVE